MEKGKNMKILYIVRGLPGAGKSTLAAKIADRSFEADAYSGLYTDSGMGIHRDMLRMAHAWCQEMVRMSLEEVDTVAVANTFTRRREMEEYYKIAKYAGARVICVKVESRFRSVHNVPKHIISMMRDRWDEAAHGALAKKYGV